MPAPSLLLSSAIVAEDNYNGSRQFPSDSYVDITGCVCAGLLMHLSFGRHIEEKILNNSVMPVLLQ